MSTIFYQLEGIGKTKTRAHLIISGEVQGVMFRHETKRRALNLNVKGWVRNRDNGTVEAVFEGEEQDVESMIVFCKRGPPGAIVTDVIVTPEKYVGEFDRFSVV
ncbi:MAG TPA: acylphosphatase [Candidatus Sulfotelmatobacter sp.]|jgi:acylphosphatase|nr:acylphosphatase [Candidatus Sulfotelmatobacter sp.]